MFYIHRKIEMTALFSKLFELCFKSTQKIEFVNIFVQNVIYTGAATIFQKNIVCANDILWQFKVQEFNFNDITRKEITEHPQKKKWLLLSRNDTLRNKILKHSTFFQETIFQNVALNS